MSADSPILVEVPDVWDHVPVAEFIPLHLILRRPADQIGSVTIPFINHSNKERVELDTDFFQGEITLQPGECYAFTLGVRFTVPGQVNLSEFYVQVIPQTGQPKIIPLPNRSVRVLPSLEKEMQIIVARVCGYNQGVKLEVVIRHIGHTVWKDFAITIGPPQQGRGGVTHHQKPLFKPGDLEERIDVVLAGETIELSLAGSVDGERISHQHSQPIPAAEETQAGYRPYAFLEPRGLTIDRISITPVGGGPEVQADQGIYPVLGGGNQYIVQIKPSNLKAEAVSLLRVAGRAEVESMNAQDQLWEFQLTTVENFWMTQLVRLYYDVQLPGRVLRGELYLSIRPTSSKLWIIAITAGTAITLKGITSLLPAFLNAEPHWDEWLGRIAELMHKQWTDWLQLLSIPLLRSGLALLDRLIRSYQGI